MAGLISSSKVFASPIAHTIYMDSDVDGTKVWFDPIGLFVKPGDKISWVIKNNVHTVAAYHPDNDNHSLRIPHKARPWSSEYLVEPGDYFEIILSEPGVYDYYCEPHEEAGMVGRIVVGEVSGPGALPFNYYTKLEQVPDWKVVPQEAQNRFPSAQKIRKEKIVRI